MAGEQLREIREEVFDDDNDSTLDVLWDGESWDNGDPGDEHLEPDETGLDDNELNLAADDPGDELLEPLEENNGFGDNEPNLAAGPSHENSARDSLGVCGDDFIGLGSRPTKLKLFWRLFGDCLNPPS